MTIHCNSDWCDYNEDGVCTADEIKMDNSVCMSSMFSTDLDIEISKYEDE